MPLQPYRGQPFVGSVTLTSGTLSAPVPMQVSRNTAVAATLSANSKVVVANILISTNDSTLTPLVTITDGAPTPTTLWKGYLTNSGPQPFPVIAESFTPGVLVGYPGTALNVSASAVTPGKTVEITVNGVIVTGT